MYIFIPDMIILHGMINLKIWLEDLSKVLRIKRHFEWHYMSVTLPVALIVCIIFSPDRKYLLFLSCKTAVDSGAHSATNSLHRLDWPKDGRLDSSTTVYVVVRFLPKIYSTNV